MAIISIDRGTFSLGTEVAVEVARRLDHVCLGREAVIEAAQGYNVPEIKLTHAIENAPSVFDRIAGGRMRYIAYMKATLLRRFRTGAVVYHGFAGAHLLMDVPCVLKVRLVAHLDDRVAIVAARDGVSSKEALRIVTKTDEARRQWGLQLYGIDPENPLLYDAVVHVGNVGIDGATDFICHLAEEKPFRTTAESLATLEKMALLAATEALIAEMDVDRADVKLTAGHGKIRIGIKTPRSIRDGTSNRARSFFVKDLRDRLRERAAECLEAKVVVELIDSE